jgi:hypothetical protein
MDSTPAPPTLTPSDHPSGNELLTYSVGIPSDELVDRVNDHVAVCGECASTVSDIVRASMLAKIAETSTDV